MALPPDSPPNPYIDKGACPSEGCAYRDWITTKPMDLVDIPDGHHIVASIKAGEHVLGMTGEVHAIPLRVKAIRDYPDVLHPKNVLIKTGEYFYVLQYLGECNWLAWYKRHQVDVENCSDEGPLPKTTWWVKIKTKSGIVGWTLSNQNFAGQDALGDPPQPHSPLPQ